jgi:hypothetical protein
MASTRFLNNSAGQVQTGTLRLLRSVLRWTLVGLAGFVVANASATSFHIDIGDESIEGSSNTTLIGGIAVRTEPMDSRMIGKDHLNPNVCGRGPNGLLYYQSCQGLFRTQIFPSQHLVAAPGYASNNFDQGDLDYRQGDLVQAPFRWGQDVTMTWHGLTFFAKSLAYWDPVNDNFTEYHPNEITSANRYQVGYASKPGDELIRLGNLSQGLSALSPLVSALGLSNNIVGQLLSNPLAIPVFGVRNDSTPCPANRNPNGGPCGIVYGPGGTVYSKRKDAKSLHDVGLGFELLDINLSGTIPMVPGHDLLFKLGRQQVNWGEATIEFFDSLNIANPPNLNNFFRVGGNGLDDFYTPINMLSLGTNLFEGASVAGFYQLEWQPIGTPAPGDFDSPLNLGTKNSGQKYVTIGFGQLADDPDGVGTLLDSPLSGLTNTTSRIQRLPDREPKPWNQYGLQFKYYADWLNNGTDFGLYFANYHSRLPMASLISASAGCAKNATSLAGVVVACPDLPLLQGLYSPNNPTGATSNDIAFDSAKVFLEYPQNIKMIGVSFNTTVGAIALQGEAAFRPRDPEQVAIVDLGFAAFGPTLTSCEKAPGCPLGVGALPGLGVEPDGSVGLYPGSRFVVDGNGTPGPYNDVISAVIGDIPPSSRAFTNFIIPYRGGTIGENPPNSYIRGWENFKTLSLDLGGTYVEGSTDFTPKLIHADQVIWIVETGARGILDLPPLDRLQLEGPGIQYGAAAGADGSGANRSRQACSTSPDCSYGPDGVRFNPHQQDLRLFPTAWSGGYSIVSLIRYESVMPGISLQPQIIFKHDVFGHSPGLASNYVQGRILWDTNLEVRYRSQLSFNFGYQFWDGGGVANAFRDRDMARFFVKYAF